MFSGVQSFEAPIQHHEHTLQGDLLQDLPPGTTELDYTTFCRKVMDRDENDGEPICMVRGPSFSASHHCARRAVRTIVAVLPLIILIGMETGLGASLKCATRGLIGTTCTSASESALCAARNAHVTFSALRLVGFQDSAPRLSTNANALQVMRRQQVY